MYSYLKSLFLLFIVSAAFVACEKEYSVEGLLINSGTTGGTSVFSLDGAPGACNSPQVQGTYTAGTATTASNNVVITVNVTALGTYTLSTNTSNGVKFSSSGTFTTLGFQTIQLNATGTPTASGTFNYLAGAASCSFPITVVGGSGGGGGSSSGTAVYVFNGNPTACTTPTINGTYQQGTALTSANTFVIKANVTTAGTYLITTTNNGMTFTASGTFTATGANQDVTFTGTGTPTNSGSINFSTGAATVGCTVTIPVTASSGGGGTIFLRATIAGTAKTFNEALVGDNTPGTPGAVVIDGDETTASTSPYLNVTFAGLLAPITTGAYTNLSPSNFNKGILITYNNGTTDFMSSSSIANSSQGNLTTYTATGATGTFSGTLYNNNGMGPGTVVVTAGSFNITY